MAIVNNGKEHGETVDMIRGAIEHRATWMYLLMDEARKKGLEWDDFARAAIFKCGQFHGSVKLPDTESIKEFGTAFAYDTLKDVFDMEVIELNEDRFIIEMNYCPLVSGWMQQTDNEKDIDHLCDIAMDGDRGIVDQYPSFQFDLQSTIAKGDSVCRVEISKKKI